MGGEPPGGSYGSNSSGGAGYGGGWGGSGTPGASMMMPPWASGFGGGYGGGWAPPWAQQTQQPAGAPVSPTSGAPAALTQGGQQFNQPPPFSGSYGFPMAAPQMGGLLSQLFGMM